MASVLHGDITEQEFYDPEPYSQLHSTNQEKISERNYQNHYEAFKKDTSLCWKKIRYTVDNLSIVGFTITPHLKPNKKYPAIVYNRGGIGEIGKVGLIEYPLFKYFTDRGYVIFASQYRGVDGGDGIDQFGGNDINDILEITRIAQKQLYVDPDNIFMLGWSRGGMMTYLALKQGTPINAAVSCSGIADLALCMEEWRGGKKAFQKMLQPHIPEFANESYAFLACANRSAVCFADEIKTPLLLMHGSLDGDIFPNQSRLLAESLKQAKCKHELFIFKGDHTLPFEHLDKINDWFQQHSI